MKHSFLKTCNEDLIPVMLAIYIFFADILSLNSQMPKSSKTRKMSNFQMLSNSDDFKKLISRLQYAVCTTPHSAPHDHQVKVPIFQSYDFSRNNPLLKIQGIWVFNATMTKHATSRIELHDVSDFIMLTFDRRHFGKNIFWFKKTTFCFYLILRILSEMNISWQIEEIRV